MRVLIDEPIETRWVTASECHNQTVILVEGIVQDWLQNPHAYDLSKEASGQAEVVISPAETGAPSLWKMTSRRRATAGLGAIRPGSGCRPVLPFQPSWMSSVADLGQAYSMQFRPRCLA